MGYKGPLRFGKISCIIKRKDKRIFNIKSLTRNMNSEQKYKLITKCLTDDLGKELVLRTKKAKCIFNIKSLEASYYLERKRKMDL